MMGVETIQQDGESADIESAGGLHSDGSHQHHNEQLQRTQSVQDSPSDDQTANAFDRKYERQQDTNPYRSLGDALKAWKDRLNLQDVNKLDEDYGDESLAEEHLDEETDDTTKADAFQFVRDHEASDAQVLGSATEEQVDQQREPIVQEDAQEIEDVLEPTANDDASVTKTDIRERSHNHDNEAVIEEEKDNSCQDENEDNNPSENREKEPPINESGTSQQVDERTDALEDVDSHIGIGDIKFRKHGIYKEDSTRIEEENQHNESQELTEEERESMRKNLEEKLDRLRAKEQQNSDSLEAIQASLEAWYELEELTSSLSYALCEQLRLVLEASRAAKMKGDYRTGKRLNMRKVIPYIASQFRKDKIWLRRTKPSKREYQIILAIDNSRSMSLYHSQQMALESMCLISKALEKLEAGELCVMKFGESVDVVHKADEPFTSTSGAECLRRFTFAEDRTRIGQLLQHTSVILSDMANKRQRQPNLRVSQLLFVVSDTDNLYQEGESLVEQAVQELRERNVFLVFVIINSPVKKRSILNQSSVSFIGNKVVKVDYMDRFSDKNYIVLR